MVDGVGFEPTKAEPADLQSAPFSHSGTHPYGAGERTWTPNLLITSQLLYQLSYTSINWKIFGCGDRTRTCDLRVMSPTSYQLLHPAMYVVEGEGFEPSKSKTADLQSAPFGHSGIPPNKMELAIGIEPTTCWLQVSCSTNWATPASHDKIYYNICHLHCQHFFEIFFRARVNSLIHISCALVLIKYIMK